jgi:hypothetical protein
MPLFIVIGFLHKAVRPPLLEKQQDPPDGDCVRGELMQAKVHVPDSFMGMTNPWV